LSSGGRKRRRFAEISGPHNRLLLALGEKALWLKEGVAAFGAAFRRESSGKADSLIISFLPNRKGLKGAGMIFLRKDA